MTIKFITLNIFHGGTFFPQVRDFLTMENPDILALQEVNNGTDLSLPDNLKTILGLNKILPGFHYHFAPELLIAHKEGKVEIGNAIFSRFPIVENKSAFFDVPYTDLTIIDAKHDYSKDPKNIHFVKIQINDQYINVFNTHGIWGLDGGDNDRRLAMSETIVNEVKGKENVILSGDFNVKPNTETIGNIEKELKNVFKNELTSTFNMKHKDNPGYATAVVDMIFTSKNMSIIDHYCPQVDVSDHLPLVMTVEI